MRILLSGVVLVIYTLYIFSVEAQVDEEIVVANITDEKNYCYRMSWLGPKYNNDSIFKNASCDDITYKANHLPCRLPLIVSFDGTEPDTNWIWDNYKSNPTHVACRLVQGEVCAKYTYKLASGALENITYMCAKAYADEGEELFSGCYNYQQNNREIEVCLCRTVSGQEYPCNSASSMKHFSTFLLPLIATFVSYFLYGTFTN